MPAFQTSGQVVRLLPNTSLAVVNDASVDTGITRTKQFMVIPPDGGGSNGITIVNTTDKDATGQISTVPFTSAAYQNASGLIVPSGSSLAYNVNAGFICFTFAVAPTSGSLVVMR